MPEILQIYHQPPPSHLQLHSHLQGNVESRSICSFESDFRSRGSFDGTENFQCSEFAGSCFTDFSSSSVDELSKVTAFVEQNQSLRKRKHESVDCNSKLMGSPKVKKIIHNGDSKPKVDPRPDYVHVRTRHGQATDRHSLAERARREKIKKKMQYLQDLVPGCNKLTNKAAILDEIITYVQCLQRHVEFLTMKLAASTTTVDFNMDILLPEE